MIFTAGADTVRMAISNTADFLNASQVPYQEEMEWKLSSCHCEPQRSNLKLMRAEESSDEIAASSCRTHRNDSVCKVYAKFYTQYGVSSETVLDSIILDTQAPTIIASSKVFYLSNQDIIIAGFTEPDGKVGVKLDNSFAGMPSIFADSTGYFSFNLGRLSVGSHTFDIKAQDQAGNTSETLTLNFTVKSLEALPASSIAPTSRISPEPAATPAPFVSPSPSSTPAPPPLAPVPESATPPAPSEVEGTPIPLNPDWNLLAVPKVEEFSPQSNEVSFFTNKFSSLSETFKKLGISQISDIASRAPGSSFTLPNLSKIIAPESSSDITNAVSPFTPVSLADLPFDQKKQIPSEIIFVSAVSEKINLDSTLVLDEGSLKQKISAPSSANLNIALKPEHPARSISGYIALKKSAYTMNDKFQISNAKSMSNDEMTNDQNNSNIENLSVENLIEIRNLKLEILSLLGFESAAAEEIKPADKPQTTETRFVLAQFQYADPDQDGIWTADIQTPAVVGEYEIISLISYQDQSIPSKEIRLITVIDPEGYAYEKSGDQELRIKNAVVSIYWLNPGNNQYELWSAQNFDQKNPQTTDATGKYSFLVPAGSYHLKAEAPGYLPYQSDNFVVAEANNAHMNLEMKLISGWKNILTWERVLLILFGIALAYNFYRDRRRKG